MRGGRGGRLGRIGRGSDWGVIHSWGGVGFAIVTLSMVDEMTCHSLTTITRN